MGEIGEGAFSTVQRARFRENNKQYAVKSIYKSQINTEEKHMMLIDEVQ
jgi:serine/threonine protein kinase